MLKSVSLDVYRMNFVLLSSEEHARALKDGSLNVQNA